MNEPRLTSVIEGKRIRDWELFLQSFPGCIDVRHGNSDVDVKRICTIFDENDALIGSGDSAAYLEGETFSAIALRVSGSWLFARYRHEVEMGLLHARIEERFLQERA